MMRQGRCNVAGVAPNFQPREPVGKPRSGLANLSSADRVTGKTSGSVVTDIRSLCVYCGSSNGVAARLLDAASDLGGMIGRAGIELIYGGGRAGMMGRAADGALAAGGRVTGIIPGHLHDREVAHPGLTELVVVASMHDRKRQMAERSDGFIVLPGGYGTLDELFEIVTWRQLGLHDKPIVVVDLDRYWQPLASLLDGMVGAGFVSEENRRLLRWVERIEDTLPAITAELPPHRAIDSARL
jgi:uncharacterized protein (TIGR00730 family)